VIYLSLSELLHVAERALGPEVPVRDYGLLESVLARPQATAFGLDAYDGLAEKTGALLHSLARNRALVDGNQRLALAATLAFLGLNGHRLTLSNDEAYTLVIQVASGLLDDVADIADRIGANIAPRR
jgi:death-on-curing protein